MAFFLLLARLVKLFSFGKATSRLTVIVATY